MEEWKEYKLGDIGRIVTGKTPLTKVSLYYDGTIHFVSPADLNNCEKYILSTSKTISDSGLQSIKGCILPKGSICISCIGNLGYVGITTMECASNQQINSIVVDESKFDVDYIYYLIKFLWRYFKSQENQSTTISIINKSTFSNIKIIAPSLSYQQKIAKVLSSLDDKIEVNLRINKQLEELAQVLFKSWFVDFDPFNDGEFVESELGMIPEGWKVCELNDFGQIVCGKTPSKDNKDFYGGNIPFIKIPDMHNNIFVWNTTDWLSNKGDASQVNKRIPPYSICVSCIATVGLVAINTTFAHTNQQINTIIPNNAFERYYLFEQLKSMKEYLQNLGRGGTATLNVNTRLFGSIKVLRPSEKVLKEYDGVINGFFKKIELNQQEVTHLTNLRDTLLPKLMSGEIDVNEVEI